MGRVRGPVSPVVSSEGSVSDKGMFDRSVQEDQSLKGGLNRIRK